MIAVPCPSCRRAQPVSPRHLEDDPTCETCEAPLDGFEEPIEVGDGDFDELIERVSRPVLVHFWAPWCEACRCVEPELVQLARRHDSLLIAELDTTQNPRVATARGIRSLPTFALFEHGVCEHTASGYMTVDQIERQFGFGT